MESETVSERWHRLRTQALNRGERLEPLVQDKAESCEYCRAELKGPCASQFALLYKCAQAHGKMISAQQCQAVRQLYVCVFVFIFILID